METIDRETQPPLRRHFEVHMSPYRCANGAWAGPYRVTLTGDQYDAIDSALYIWAPDRKVYSVIERAGMLDDTVLAMFDDEGHWVAAFPRRPVIALSAELLS